eukprot:TRINITY_DN8545_c0_g1_i4.p1 TRINITY_DN8545_c0_g1~~TRINITY_DN8545_c0_g1_i4.p1  ORF type:complete len:172 (+),score=36.11 TRINITY_DN8545_c0_g1_i4:78-593(+)
MIEIFFLLFFFFKQKTAYEMLRSLVGSEMCIRDRSMHAGSNEENPVEVSSSKLCQLCFEPLLETRSERGVIFEDESSCQPAFHDLAEELVMLSQIGKRAQCALVLWYPCVRRIPGFPLEIVPSRRMPRHHGVRISDIRRPTEDPGQGAHLPLHPLDAPSMPNLEPSNSMAM